MRDFSEPESDQRFCPVRSGGEDRKLLTYHSNQFQRTVCLKGLNSIRVVDRNNVSDSSLFRVRRVVERLVESLGLRDPKGETSGPERRFILLNQRVSTSRTVCG